MKSSYTRAYVLVLLAFLLLTFSPQSLAQGVLSGPSVRVVYFLPKDRPARPERITALQVLIKESQTFFAEQMESHGFGRKTFRIETDTRGTPVVHRVNGKFNEKYYYTGNSDFKIWEEFYDHFEDREHVYLIAIDLSWEALNDGEACGLGGIGFIPMGGEAWGAFGGNFSIRHRHETSGEESHGGSAVMPASGDCFYVNDGRSHPLRLINHELGHAFGLDHDYSAHDAVVGGLGYQLSECAAEWFSVHRFFNTTPNTTDQSGSVSLLDLQASRQNEIRLRFQVSDPNGLHQAQLLMPEDGSWGPLMLIDCQALDGQTQTIEFVTSELTALSAERVVLQFMDDLGNITWATILVDIAYLIPPPKVVSIPDRNLAAAIRETLGLDRIDPITDRQMLKLRELYAGDKHIKNLTGLEHAKQLIALNLGRNPEIKSYAPLAQLPKLRTLYLWGNNISDLSVLPPLPQLEFLDLNWNTIRDVSPLAGFTSLKELWLWGSPLANTSTLFELHNGIFPADEEVEVIQEQDTENRIYTLLVFRSLDLKVRISATAIIFRSANSARRGVDSHPQAVPTTGTWFAIRRPSRLAPADFTIKPGEFVILAPYGKSVSTGGTEYNNSFSFGKTENFPNLARFFQNGGRIELVSHASLNPLPPNTHKPQFGDLVITEILWGLNKSSPDKQYIELYNASAYTYTFTNGDLSFRFSTTAEDPLPDAVFPLPTNPHVWMKGLDRVSNKGWKVPGKSGNLSENEPLISMYRTMDYTTGDIPDGTLASSWKASTGRVNLSAPSYGTPGARHLPPRPVVLVAASQRPPMYWIDADAGTLHRLIGDEVEPLLPTVKNATSLAVDMAGGRLYWTEKTGSTMGKIQSANLDDSNVQLVKTLTSVPHGIALDAVNGKIYVTNGWGKVQRLNVDGSNFQANLITGLNAPNDIVVDSTGSKIYWIEPTRDRRGRIQCATLNGSNVQLVKAFTSMPLGIALDPSRNKLYVTNAYGKVQRLSTNGSDFQPNFITGLDTLKDVAVDVAHSKLYWTEKGSIQRADLNGGNIQEVITGVGSPGSIVLGTPSMPPVERDTPREPVTYASTDVNQDKKVNKTDLLLVVMALGESPPANPNFDVNVDGTVNIADVLLVIEALDDPVAAAAPSFKEPVTSLDPQRLVMQIDILRAESDGSLKYEHAIAFFQSLLSSFSPSETQLLANYPNPFNPETWIPYHLAKPAKVTVAIYATDGTLVRTLALGHQPAGMYQSKGRAAYWDGTSALGEPVASGVYFYTLTAGEFRATRKLLIRK